MEHHTALVLSAAIMDLCHEGHQNLLGLLVKAADEIGWDSKRVLVIMVLHDDASCWRIKGKFPIQPLEQRMANAKTVLEAYGEPLGVETGVVSTDSVDPGERFEEILAVHSPGPRLFMRGDDNEDFPGRWAIDAHEIPIEFIDYTKGVSSSTLRFDLENGHAGA